MKISNFYNNDASEEWFTKSYGRRPSVHETLIERGFEVFGKESLNNKLSEQELPLSLTPLSWGGVIPSPLRGFENTYIAKEISDFPNCSYDSENLSELISRWIKLLPSKKKYLVSLNPNDYLVTCSESIRFEDVQAVSRAWKIDCWIGVVDESCTMSIIFDVEFGLVIISFDPSITPDGYAEFSQRFNNEFKDSFVRDASVRMGTDPLRAAEYKDKSLSLIG